MKGVAAFCVSVYNTKSIARAFILFFLIFLPKAIFGLTGKNVLLVNYDSWPMACITNTGFVSLKTLLYIFFHAILIFIRDACGSWHAMCTRVKIVMAELSEHVAVINNFHGVKVTSYAETTIQTRLRFSKSRQCFS